MGSWADTRADGLRQVFCVHSEPNYSLPWQRKRQISSTGSGFIISGKRILTNAHCVDHHTQARAQHCGCSGDSRGIFGLHTLLCICIQSLQVRLCPLLLLLSSSRALLHVPVLPRGLALSPVRPC